VSNTLTGCYYVHFIILSAFNPNSYYRQNIVFNTDSIFVIAQSHCLKDYHLDSFRELLILGKVGLIYKSIWYIPYRSMLISKIPVKWKFHLVQVVGNFTIRYNVSSCLNSDLLRELLCRINFVQCQK
jgi:hypothetical protein